MHLSLVLNSKNCISWGKWYTVLAITLWAAVEEQFSSLVSTKEVITNYKHTKLQDEVLHSSFVGRNVQHLFVQIKSNSICSLFQNYSCYHIVGFIYLLLLAAWKEKPSSIHFTPVHKHESHLFKWWPVGRLLPFNNLFPALLIILLVGWLPSS